MSARVNQAVSSNLNNNPPPSESTSNQFGTFGGVFTPSILTILGWFSSRKAAEDFAAQHAAKVLELDQIPADAVMAPVELMIPGEEKP